MTHKQAAKLVAKELRAMARLFRKTMREYDENAEVRRDVFYIGAARAFETAANDCSLRAKEVLRAAGKDGGG